jgi:hypothetical protein
MVARTTMQIAMMINFSVGRLNKYSIFYQGFRLRDNKDIRISFISFM